MAVGLKAQPFDPWLLRVSVWEIPTNHSLGTQDAYFELENYTQSGKVILLSFICEID